LFFRRWLKDSHLIPKHTHFILLTTHFRVVNNIFIFSANGKPLLSISDIHANIILNSHLSSILHQYRNKPEFRPPATIFYFSAIFSAVSSQEIAYFM